MIRIIAIVTIMLLVTLNTHGQNDQRLVFKSFQTITDSGTANPVDSFILKVKQVNVWVLQKDSVEYKLVAKNSSYFLSRVNSVKQDEQEFLSYKSGIGYVNLPESIRNGNLVISGLIVFSKKTKIRMNRKEYECDLFIIKNKLKTTKGIVTEKTYLYFNKNLLLPIRFDSYFYSHGKLIYTGRTEASL